MLKDIVIVDIDGTIAKMGDRIKYITECKPKDYDSFYAHCEEDAPINDILDVVMQLAKAYRIVFCTGRREQCREQTERWLNHYICIPMDYTLLMRKGKDHRPDVDVTPELLQKANINPRRVLCILEDRDSMVRKWRELGFTCLQANEGNF